MPGPRKRRDRQFSVYVTPGQLAVIDLLARRAERPRAEYVREILLAHCQTELRGNGLRYGSDGKPAA